MPALRPDHLLTAHPSRLRPEQRGFAEIVERHRVAVESGRPSYRDPLTGFTVFTAAFLAQRGYCCSSGCRHCPYEV